MISWQMIDNQQFTKAARARGRVPAGHDRRYVEQIGAFDIETTTVWTREILGSYPDRTEVHFTPHAVMYVWQFAINDTVYYGRTWDEFKEFLRHLSRRLPSGHRLLAFVHNLSFEHVFLSGVFDIPREALFPIEPRKILRVDLTDFLELRCSYLLTNRSLAQFLKAEGVEAQKGEMNYTTKRYPWTKLTAEELLYCERDVLGLTQAIRHRLQETGDTVYTLPFTSTGYVRRLAKKAMLSERRHDDYTADKYSVYVRLRHAFRGGNTHASRYWVALGAVKDDVYGDDFASAYPAQICDKLYPDRPFTEIPACVFGRDGTHEEYIRGLIDRNYAVLMTITLTDVKVDDAQHVPYIPLDKCYFCYNGAIDNGRVLRADRLSITITDVDFGIIANMYTWSDLELTYCATSGYAPLPKAYIELTRELFRRKTAWKWVNDYEYDRSKELINAMFGMLAMDPLRAVIEYDEDGILEEKAPEDPKAAYEKGAKKCFMPYSWGVWLTAHARADLQKAIDACGDDFLYCDTDSVKHLQSDKGLGYIFKGDSYEAFDHAGNPHRMGVMERDTHYIEFASLGAKKYVVRYADDMGKKAGKLEITIAGVGKIQGSAELEKAGGIDAFKEGFIFHQSGIDAFYNDYDCFSYITGCGGCGNHLTITRNVALVQGRYTLGVSKTYRELLDDINAGREAIIDPFDLPLD